MKHKRKTLVTKDQWKQNQLTAELRKKTPITTSITEYQCQLDFTKVFG